MSFKVLIVEDEDILREIWVEQFQDLNCETFEAANGDQGVDVLKDQHIDLVITDLMMPKADGTVVLNHISTMAKQPLTYVCSGYLRSSEESLKGQYNFIRIINKPFDIIRVMDEIKEHFFDAQQKVV